MAPGYSISRIPNKVIANEVAEAEFNNNTGKIAFKSATGEKYKKIGPIELSSEDESLFLENISDFKFRH